MKKSEIVIWHEMDGVGDTSIRLIEEICDDLQEKQGIHFKLEGMNIRELNEKIKHFQQENQKPDIMLIPQDMVDQVRGNIFPIPETFNRYMDAKVWNTMKYKGVQLGIPFLQGNHGIMYYNKNYFSKTPTDWEDIININKVDVIPISIDLSIAFWIMPFVCSFGGYPIQDGRIDMDNVGLTKGAEFLSDLVDRNVLTSYNASDTMLEKFIKGEIASIINGEWIYEYLDKELGSNLGVCRLPKINGKKMRGVSSSVGMVFLKDSCRGEKKEEIYQFADYILSEKIQKKWFERYKRLPVNQYVLKDFHINKEEGMSEILEQMKNNYLITNDDCMPLLWNVWEKSLLLCKNGSIKDFYANLIKV